MECSPSHRRLRAWWPLPRPMAWPRTPSTGRPPSPYRARALARARQLPPQPTMQRRHCRSCPRVKAMTTQTLRTRTIGASPTTSVSPPPPSRDTVRMKHTTFKSGAIAAVALIALCASHEADAQAIERHLPPAPAAEPAPLLRPNATPENQDAQPIGPVLSGLLLLGPDTLVRTDSVHELNTALVPRLNETAARAQLSAFMGQPISHKLIAQIEASIARYYRRKGFPFVSVSTPPQTIGGGMLQVRVIEFRAGEVKVSGVGSGAAQQARQGVPLQPDQPIDALLL